MADGLLTVEYSRIVVVVSVATDIGGSTNPQTVLRFRTIVCQWIVV